MLGMGFVYNWSGLMAARWFLGLTEAGLFPGINYYLSCWYKRSEFGVRAVGQIPCWDSIDMSMLITVLGNLLFRRRRLWLLRWPSRGSN